MAYIKAINGHVQWDMQPRNFLSEARAYDNSEMVISILDGGEGGVNLRRILEDVIKRVTKEAQKIVSSVKVFHPWPYNRKGSES